MSERCSQGPLFEASDRYRISLRLIAILTVALCLSLNVMAQTSLGTSSVGGIVLDPTSLGIQGVAVQLIDTQRGTTRNTLQAVKANIYLPLSCLISIQSSRNRKDVFSM